MSAVLAEAQPATVAEKAFQGIDFQEKTFKLRYGDTLGNILKKAGVSREQITAAIVALEEVFDPSQIKAGRSVSVTAGGGELRELAIKPKPGNTIGLKRSESGAFEAWAQQIEGVTRTLHARAAMTTSLAQVSRALGVPRMVLAEAVAAFSYEIDFQRDIRPDNYFDFLYEVTKDAGSGEVIGAQLLRASIDYRDKSMLIYRYEARNQQLPFYHKDGSSVVRSLLRTPINAMRISSRFGRRLDPILGYTRMHRGVDFAAPVGTPIYAAGKGAVEKVGWHGNYGRYVRIRHDETYSTAYAHLREFAKGVGSGTRVQQGQVIGYVGSTGRSTGPHLHFEVHKNKVKVNPLKLALPPSERLRDEELRAFRRQVVGIDALYLAALEVDYPSMAAATDINAQGGE